MIELGTIFLSLVVMFVLAFAIVAAAWWVAVNWYKHDHPSG